MYHTNTNTFQNNHIGLINHPILGQIINNLINPEFELLYNPTYHAIYFPRENHPPSIFFLTTKTCAIVLIQGGGAGASGLGGEGGASTAGGAPNEQLNIQNLQSILQNMGFSPQEQVRWIHRQGFVQTYFYAFRLSFVKHDAGFVQAIILPFDCLLCEARCGFVTG